MCSAQRKGAKKEVERGNKKGENITTIGGKKKKEKEKEVKRGEEKLESGDSITQVHTRLRVGGGDGVRSNARAFAARGGVASDA